MLRNAPIRVRFSLAIAAPLLCAVTVSGQSPTLIRDFNTAPNPEILSSGALPVASLPNGDALLVAYVPGRGRELWRTDGTAAGTVFLADLQPGYRGSAPHQFVELPSGLVVFTATTVEHGWELWATDGTTAGTRLVKDIFPGPTGSVGVNLQLAGRDVIFFANDGVHGIEPWRSDGTAAGTQMIADVNPFGSMSNGTAELVVVGPERFLFTARVTSPAWELWSSDKTAAGTVKVQDIPGTVTFRPNRLTRFGSRALFHARVLFTNQEEVWVSDGSAAGTFPLGVGGTGGFQTVGNRAYFTGPDAEPWVTDGFPTGTRQVIDLAQGTGFLGQSRPAWLGELGGEVVFSASYGGVDRDLFISDGTAIGTRWLGSAATFGTFSADQAVRIGNTLYFQAQDQGVDGVFRTDGTPAGTRRLTSSPGRGFRSTHGQIVFLGEDATNGAELWRTNGTTSGSGLLIDLAAGGPRTLGSRLWLMTPHRDRVIFGHDDGNGDQLWSTDGTSAGTRQISALPGAARLGAWSNDDWLLVLDARTPDLPAYVSDGTLAGLRPLQVAPSYGPLRISQVIPFGDRMLFQGTTAALGSELWISDGTMAGTNPIADIVPGNGGLAPYLPQPYGDRVVFLGRTPASGAEPWITDGTAAGTMQLAEVFPGTAGFNYLFAVEAGGKLFFAPSDVTNPDTELWVSDGTPAGTMELDLVPGSAGASPALLTPFGDLLAFTIREQSLRRLAVTDGTIAGTRVLSPPASIERIERVSAREVIVWIREGDDRIAWVTDGSFAGTRRLGALPFFSSYADIAAHPTDDSLLLEVVDPIYGHELFVTDGTRAGTRLLIDLAPEDSSPNQLMRAGTRLVTVADDGTHGIELHGIDLALMGDETVEEFGFGCPGTNGVTPKLDVEGEADAGNGLGFQVVVERALPNVPVILALGTAPVALPTGGCTTWVGGQLGFQTATTDAAGVASFPLRAVPALVGLQLVAQAYTADPNGALFGVAAATAGLEIILGP